MSEHRVAYADVADGALVLGHPDGTHVRLTTAGVEAVVPAGAEGEGWTEGWSDVGAIAVQTRASRARRPGLVAGALASASAALGLDELVPEAPTVVKVVVRGDVRVLACTGYVGRGYHAGSVAALERLLVELPASSSAQAALADPVTVLASLAV